MALLQLAENGMYLSEDTNPMKDYIFVPGGMFGVTEDTYVRQDFFDGLDEKEFEAVISSLAPFQNTGISAGAVEFAVGLLPGGAVASKGIAIAKGLIANRKKRVESGTANPILKGKSGSLIAKVKGAVEKITGKVDQQKNLPAVDVSGTVGGGWSFNNSISNSYAASTNGNYSYPPTSGWVDAFGNPTNVTLTYLWNTVGYQSMSFEPNVSWMISDAYNTYQLPFATTITNFIPNRSSSWVWHEYWRLNLTDKPSEVKTYRAVLYSESFGQSLYKSGYEHQINLTPF